MFEQIQKKLKPLARNSILFGLRHARLVFFGLSVLALLAGILVFYFSAFRVTQQTYEEDVRIRQVNSTLLEDMTEYVESRRTETENLPQNDPFTP